MCKQSERARALDASDPLGVYRSSFSGLSADLIYLDGNSLGPLPAQTKKVMERAVGTEWGEDKIKSWNKGWFDLPLRLGDLLGPLIGAGTGQVVFADSVTVNLFKLASAALARQEGRLKILTDDLNFPSDYYAIEGLINGLKQGHKLVRVASPDGMSLPSEELAAAIDSDTALVTISHVVFKSGYLYDLEAIVEAAHKAGALVLADLSHSAGSVPIELDRWGVDMAIGCSYKYLNGGPGAPAYLYVRESLQEELLPLLSGWFGAQEPFSFSPHYLAASGIQRFLVGTPPILSMRAVEPGIQLLLDAGMQSVREKSIQQTEFLIELYDQILVPLGFALGSPRDPARRGSHVSLRHPEAFRINKAMISPIEGRPVVIPDFRTPDNLRLGVAPLYQTFEELARAVERIREIVVDQEFTRFEEGLDVVT
ncbi:kynureninase [Puniceicoccales bacterium CK1056]|uniref:Kynureninase n=1 Tax=Oceanipulchritudo coccoides TaxID=2706888 RepID=A0A6B2M3I4_9BACT|nr:kynureninase [Oceanipulchritudo coccoides]NDV62976.1 kynureninase [Oceanipulchritudo coccoides]